MGGGVKADALDYVRSFRSCPKAGRIIPSPRICGMRATPLGKPRSPEENLPSAARIRPKRTDTLLQSGIRVSSLFLSDVTALGPIA